MFFMHIFNENKQSLRCHIKLGSRSRGPYHSPFSFLEGREAASPCFSTFCMFSSNGNELKGVVEINNSNSSNSSSRGRCLSLPLGPYSGGYTPEL